MLCKHPRNMHNWSTKPETTATSQWKWIVVQYMQTTGDIFKWNRKYLVYLFGWVLHDRHTVFCVVSNLYSSYVFHNFAEYNWLNKTWLMQCFLLKDIFRVSTWYHSIYFFSILFNTASYHMFVFITPLHSQPCPFEQCESYTTVDNMQRT